MNIVDYIPKGHLNRITRMELVTATGRCDRTNRRLIEQARLSGEEIAYSNGVKGYYMAETPEQLIATALDIEAKVRSELLVAKALRESAARKRQGDQVNIFSKE